MCFHERQLISKTKTVREKKSIISHSTNPFRVLLERRELDSLLFLYSVVQLVKYALDNSIRHHETMQFTKVHKILTLLLNSFDHEKVIES